MIPDEKTMQFLEQQIPELAESAFRQAYWRTLDAGLSVMITENNGIYEVFPDGTKTFIKTTQPPTSVTIGEKREL